MKFAKFCWKLCDDIGQCCLNIDEFNTEFPREETIFLVFNGRNHNNFLKNNFTSVSDAWTNLCSLLNFGKTELFDMRWCDSCGRWIYSRICYFISLPNCKAKVICFLHAQFGWFFSCWRYRYVQCTYCSVHTEYIKNRDVAGAVLYGLLASGERQSWADPQERLIEAEKVSQPSPLCTQF